MDFSEKWGTDVDEAVRLALIDLKLSIDEVDVIVLEEPSRGFFGIGSKLAKVRVQPKKKDPEPLVEEEPVEVKKPEEPKVKPAPAAKAEAKPAEKKAEPKKPEVKKEHTDLISELPADLVDVEEHVALDFLKDVTEKMNLKLDITAKGNDSSLYVNIKGKDSGTIIGKRGQTLDSIQYLTSLVVNKGKDKYVRIIIDAENYRSKREKTLEQLANRLAKKVMTTKKTVKLEPMNPYERKVIHATLQNNPSITTRSEGEEPYRRVIIELK